MRSKTLIGFLIANIAGALGLGVLSVLALRGLTENNNLEVRRNNTLSVARVFETGSTTDAIARYERAHPDARNRVWLVGGSGERLAANTADALPERWESLPRPALAHEMGFSYQWLGLTPAVTVMRLEAAEPRFLVMASSRDGRFRRRSFLEVVLFGVALAFSAVISVLTTFLYLRSKSREARAVLLRLEQGDLQARFQIRQFDEMGSLMLDFNRMASEIERLVGRLQETEQARRTLFQELSHDLRTPLTSLRASIDTLASHWEEMPTPHREEIVGVCQTEISYFMELLESLLFIAQMDEPRYKKNTEPVNLAEILDGELQARKAQGKINWELNVPSAAVDATIPGDAHLIRRLIRNALENAARFARTQVKVSLSREGAHLRLRIHDDGPGMTPEEIDAFGKPRNRRLVNPTQLPHVSLGLGSVIMTKILELHQGTLQLRNTQPGTLFQVDLPL